MSKPVSATSPAGLDLDAIDVRARASEDQGPWLRKTVTPSLSNPQHSLCGWDTDGIHMGPHAWDHIAGLSPDVVLAWVEYTRDLEGLLDAAESLVIACATKAVRDIDAEREACARAVEDSDEDECVKEALANRIRGRGDS